MANALTITFILYSILASALVSLAAGRSIITTPAAAMDNTPPIQKWLKNLSPVEKESLTKLQFYMHDFGSGKNQSVYTVAEPAISSESPTGFGRVFVIDHLLTVSPELDSEKVGRAQGIIARCDFNVPAIGVNWNFLFNDGSTITVLGRLAIYAKEGELSIVGGTGKYQMARGIALKKTVMMDPDTQNNLFEYTLYVYSSGLAGLFLA